MRRILRFCVTLSGEPGKAVAGGRFSCRVSCWTSMARKESAVISPGRPERINAMNVGSDRDPPPWPRLKLPSPPCPCSPPLPTMGLCSFRPQAPANRIPPLPVRTVNGRGRASRRVGAFQCRFLRHFVRGGPAPRRTPQRPRWSGGSCEASPDWASAPKGSYKGVMKSRLRDNAR